MGRHPVFRAALERACMPGALRPYMGGPFKGAYRATSLNHTARVPCAPGSGPKPRGPATRGRWQAAQSAPPTPFPHARRGAGEAAGSLNRLSRRHDPQSPHHRSLRGGVHARPFLRGSPWSGAPVPAQKCCSYNGPFAVPSYGVRPGGYFWTTGAKGIPF